MEKYMPKNVLNIMIVLFCLNLSAGIAEAQSFAHPGGLHSRSQIEIAQKKINAGEQSAITAYEALIQQAQANLEKPSQAVEDYSVPGYYIDADGHRKMMGRLSNDAWTAYSCALAFQLTAGKEKVQYAKKAIGIINAWASTNKKTSNYDGDLAMADAGAGLVFAAELMTNCNEWKKEERAEFKTWVRTVYLKSCEKIAGRANNWGDWGLVGMAASYYHLDDAEALDKTVDLLKDKIDKAIEANGSMPHETKREKRGLWYTYFALAPLTSACQIVLNARGADLFHYKGKDGAGIEEALDYLLHYTREPEKWPHHKEADLLPGTPAKHPGNLYEAMFGIYGKKEYEAWIKDARPIMVYGHHYAWAVPTLLRTVTPQKSVQR